MYEFTSKIIARFAKAVLLAPLLLILLIALAIGFDFVFYKFKGRAPFVEFVLHDLPFRGQEFSKEAWYDIPEGNGSDTSCFRGSMVRSLMRQHLIAGEINRASVEALLGHSTYSVPISDSDCLGYHLGYCSGLGWDADSLFACFDDQDLLTKAGTVQH